MSIKTGLADIDWRSHDSDVSYEALSLITEGAACYCRTQAGTNVTEGK